MNQEESYSGLHSDVALAQRRAQFDVNLTVFINRAIRASKAGGRHVQVGTVNGRVTLRGWVINAEEKSRIVAIAVASTRLELVDDQIVVGKPLTAN